MRFVNPGEVDGLTNVSRPDLSHSFNMRTRFSRAERACPPRKAGSSCQCLALGPPAQHGREGEPVGCSIRVPSKVLRMISACLVHTRQESIPWCEKSKRLGSSRGGLLG